MNRIKIDNCTKTVYGSWNENRKCFEINYSDILTKLIQETGRWCEKYASDLFIDWEYLLKAMEKPDFIGGQWIFAMRADGVDNYQTAKIRITEPCYGYNSDFYRAIWGLDIDINQSEKSMKMSLAKIDSYQLEKFLKENS